MSSRKKIALTDCRNVIHWKGTKGFHGLAAHGPEGGSHIGSTAPAVTLYGVTSVADCGDEATRRFKEWSDGGTT